MRRIHVFLFILTASLSLLVVLFAVSLYLATTAPTSYQSSWMQQMWGGWGMNGMMGESYGGYRQPQTASSYLWTIPVGVIGLAVISIIGVAFFTVFPEIIPASESYATAKKGSIEETSGPNGRPNPIESVYKTLTVDERKVLDVLVAHQGRYLQKYIRREADLSRLKTHRIIARFVQRGIVTLKQWGNTNEIILRDWLQRPEASNPA